MEEPRLPGELPEPAPAAPTAVAAEHGASSPVPACGAETDWNEGRDAHPFGRISSRAGPGPTDPPTDDRDADQTMAEADDDGLPPAAPPPASEPQKEEGAKQEEEEKGAVEEAQQKIGHTGDKQDGTGLSNSLAMAEGAVKKEEEAEEAEEEGGAMAHEQQDEVMEDAADTAANEEGDEQKTGEEPPKMRSLPRRRGTGRKPKAEDSKRVLPQRRNRGQRTDDRRLREGHDLVGMAVEVWWALDRCFYKGRIDQCHGNGPGKFTYNILYDDGEYESGMHFSEYSEYKCETRGEYIRVRGSSWLSSALLQACPDCVSVSLCSLLSSPCLSCPPLCPPLIRSGLPLLLAHVLPLTFPVFSFPRQRLGSISPRRVSTSSCPLCLSMSPSIGP